MTTRQDLESLSTHPREGWEKRTRSTPGKAPETLWMARSKPQPHKEAAHLGPQASGEGKADPLLTVREGWDLAPRLVPPLFLPG